MMLHHVQTAVIQRMNRYFEHLSSVQIKLIKEKICANFKPTGEEPAVYDYDTAINRYKLALFNTLVKKEKQVRKHIPVLRFHGSIVES